MGAGRFGAHLEPATELRFQPKSLSLAFRIPGKGPRYGFLGPTPDLMNQEARVYVKKTTVPPLDDLDV